MDVSLSLVPVWILSSINRYDKLRRGEERIDWREKMNREGERRSSR